jgi:hypothetical protein
MSVEGLRFTWRDTGTIAGVSVALAAGNPVPAMPLSESSGLIAVEVEVDASVTLWLASASPLATFDYLYVLAGELPSVDGLADSGTTPDLAGRLTLTCNVDDAAESTWMEQLRAGCPYRRFSNVALDANGDAGIVNRLTYLNNTVDTVTVRVYLAQA